MGGAAGSDFLLLDRASAPPRGLTSWLTDAVRAAIVDGRLATGSALPPTRTLAAELGVSRGVVVEAYQRLHEEGLVDARTRGGTIVLPVRSAGGVSPRSRPASRVSPVPVPTTAHPVEFDLSPGVPDLAAFPRTAWLRAERRVLDTISPAELGYGDPRGAPRLRHELAGWLARVRGVRADAESIIVTAGVAQALALLAQTLVRRGRTVVGVEDPGSRGARDELAYWGLRPAAVPCDEDGLLVSALARTRAESVLVTPAHEFPTGVVLAPARRQDLVDWAAGGRLIIEDDYDAEQRYDRNPVAALQGSAPHLVAHTGSTSKSLAPGLRLGWLIAPAELHDDLVAARYAADLGAPALPQLVLATMLASGDYDRHLRRSRQHQRERRDALLDGLTRHLPGAVVSGVAAGLHVMVTFPVLDVDDLSLAEAVHERGVLVQPLSWHRLSPGAPGLVVGFGAQTPDRLREAAHRIGAAVASVHPATARRRFA